MPTLTPTREDGATTKPLDTLAVEPQCAVTDDQLADQIRIPDMNGAFIADLLSAMVTHERCATHLYRSVAGRTNNPVLKAKYEEFGPKMLRHAEILESLIRAMGGNPNYVSPSARAVEGADTKLIESTALLSGSLDVMTQEMAMLDAVFLVESTSQANWELLGQLAGKLPDGDVRTSLERAVGEVKTEEDEHLGWARNTKVQLSLLQARSPAAATIGATFEELVAKVRDWLK